MTKIIHVSDTHGTLPYLRGNFEAVVLTGDFAPNFSYGVDKEPYYQIKWLEEQAPNIKNWLRGLTLLFTLGNHDYMNPYEMEAVLRAEGIDAYCLHDKITNFNNINFYGFPYVPPINGMYNYECDVNKMAHHIDNMVYKINSTYVDVIAAHCPIYGCLDYCYNQFQNFGNTLMANAFDYKINKDMTPSYYLCGHIHTSHGITMRKGVLVSNAATTTQVIEL